MPNLGFLKKRKTKEVVLGPEGTPLSKSTTNDSPVTSPVQGQFPEAGHSESPNKATASSNHPEQQVAGGQSQMTPGGYQQQPGATQPEEKKHYLPHIHNLIHPPQHDGAAQSHQSTKQDSNPQQPQQHQQPQQPINTNFAADTAQMQNQQLQQPQGHAQQQPQQVRTTKGKYTLSDFEIRRTLGTGSFGRVHLVQSKHNQRFYAVKVLKKAQVVKMKQVEHTNDERRMLQEVKHPFLITLWGTFQDAKNIYMVMDFVEGGELFSLLRKSQVGTTILIHYEEANTLTRGFQIP
jgi:protein kinase A